MNRLAILGEAARLTGGERNKTYGEPFENMSNFALLVTAYLKARGFLTNLTDELDAEDAAWIMVLSKTARTVDHSIPRHADSYVDASAYTGMAGEVAVDCRPEPEEDEQ